MNGGDGSVSGFYDIDAASDALVQMLKWQSDGLVDIPAADSPVTKNYPVIVDYAGEYQQLNIDLTQYTSSIFPEPYIAYSTGFNYVAAANPGADISEFLRFMEWLGSDVGNYRYMLFGVEGTDYTQENGFITKTISDYSDISGGNDSPLSCFYNTDFDSQIRDFSSWFPNGYIQENAGLSPPEYALYWSTRLSIGSELAADAKYPGSITSAAGLMSALFTELYKAPDPPSDPSSTIRDTFDQIRALDNIDLAERLVNEALSGNYTSG